MNTDLLNLTTQIKDRLPLEDVIGETVVLKAAGKDRLRGLCPVHAEKTPSFDVVTDKGFYCCHACGAKGDLFKFVQETQSLDFKGALELLAARAGVELPEYNNSRHLTPEERAEKGRKDAEVRSAARA